MAGFLALLMGLFGCDKPTKDQYKTADLYRNMRQQVLTVDPKAIGLAPNSPNRVWGVLMETGYPEAVATLVTIADGTVSLYFSNGGGIIGVGQHEGPRKASESFLAFAPQFLSRAKRTTDYPLPREGFTRFYFMTYDGVLTIEEKEDDLGNNRSPLSPLFHKAHDVISEARVIDEKLKAEHVTPPDADKPHR